MKALFNDHVHNLGRVSSVSPTTTMDIDHSNAPDDPDPNKLPAMIHLPFLPTLLQNSTKSFPDRADAVLLRL